MSRYGKPNAKIVHINFGHMPLAFRLELLCFFAYSYVRNMQPFTH